MDNIRNNNDVFCNMLLTETLYIHQVVNLYTRRTVFVNREWCVLLTGRYYNAVHSCSLTVDIDKLSQHDDTQIDEMVLSPGQKQRIALARTLYSNRWDMWASEPLWHLWSQYNTIIWLLSIFMCDRSYLAVTFSFR